MDQPDENPNLEMNLSETKILQYCAVNGVEESNCPSPDMHISARRCSSGRFSHYSKLCSSKVSTEDSSRQGFKEMLIMKVLKKM